MSYDAEVDKNKRLTKIIEELRYQKQDLKNTMTKMQAALEKQHSSKDNRFAFFMCLSAFSSNTN